MTCEFKLISALAVAGLLSGCGNLNTAFRTYETDNLRLVSIDAKQRVITASKGSEKDSSMVTCAEPSPDALSAASASGSGSLEIASKALGLGYATSEGAAYIGLRTQTIQLLRDAMYRLCEGYASGALTKDRYHRLQRHYQSSMVALLAIEQLTGAVTARPATISSTGGVERGKLLQQAKETVDVAASAVDDSVKAKTKADAESKTATEAAKNAQAEIDKIDKDNSTTDAQKTTAKKPFQDLLDTKAVKAKANTAAAVKQEDAEADLIAAKQFQSDARNAMNLTTSATANIYLANGTHQLSKEAVKSIGESVSGIVSRVLDLSFREEVCTGAMTDALGNLQRAGKSGDVSSATIAQQVLDMTMKMCIAEPPITVTPDNPPKDTKAANSERKPATPSKPLIDRILLNPSMR